MTDHSAAYAAYVQQYGEQAARDWYNYYYGSYDVSYAASYYQGQQHSTPEVQGLAPLPEGSLPTPAQQGQALQLSAKLSAAPDAALDQNLADATKQNGERGVHSASVRGPNGNQRQLPCLRRPPHCACGCRR
jgi:hypothetical protein